MPGLEGESAADQLLADLARWAAGARVAAAAADRARIRSLTDQATATATWRGILLDLAEAGTEVAVGAGASRLAGRLVGVGRDFVVLESSGRGRPVLVRSSAIGLVTSASPDVALAAAPAGRRSPRVDIGLESALEELAGERAPVLVTTSAGPLEGDLTALGTDVAVLRQKGGRILYVPITALVAVELR